ncbi:MAG: thermonuclease family protein [Chloroflexota bacterium]|nr:thermonuclease family protein [Chloroflexota bacterium]
MIDGDTIRVDLDLGLWTHRVVNLRIAGIDTPELNRGTEEERARGRAARDYLVADEGREVYIQTYKDRKTFDRYIADVYLVRPGGVLDSVADIMLAAGHAVRVE